MTNSRLEKVRALPNGTRFKFHPLPDRFRINNSFRKQERVVEVMAGDDSELVTDEYNLSNEGLFGYSTTEATEVIIIDPKPAQIDPATLVGRNVRLTGTWGERNGPKHGDIVTITAPDYLDSGPQFEHGGKSYYVILPEVPTNNSVWASNRWAGELLPEAEPTWEVEARVRVVRTEGNVYISLGDEYTIEDLWVGGDHISITPSGGRGISLRYPKDLFELIKEDNMNTFKVGDRVRRTADHVAASKYPKGTEFTVASLWDDGRGVYSDDRVSHNTGRLELVTSSPAEISRYDERLLPMFTTLANEADARGYCREYDRLAAVVGAPSRAEIKKLNAPTTREQFDALSIGDQFRYSGNPSVTYIKIGSTRLAPVNGSDTFNVSTLDNGTITKL